MNLHHQFAAPVVSIQSTGILRMAPRGLRLAALAMACAVVSGCGVFGKSDLQKRKEFSEKSVYSVVSQEPRSLLAESQIDEVRGTTEYAEIQAAEQRLRLVARRAGQPYIGSVMVPVTTEDRLPSVFFESVNLEISGDAAAGSGAVSLGAAMARLSRSVQIPIRIQPDVYIGSAAQQQGSLIQASQSALTPSNRAMPNANQQAATPGTNPGVAGGNNPSGNAGGGFNAVMPPSPLVQGAAAANVIPISPTGVRSALPAAPAQQSQPPALSLLGNELRYSGPLVNYLNMVTDRLGLSWEYRDNTVVIMRFVNEMHEVFTMDTVADASMSTSGSGSGGGGGQGANNAAASSLQVSEKSRYDPVTSIEKTLQLMLKDIPGSEVNRSEGSGRFLIKTTREMQGRIRDYVRSENASMKRQAQIQFDIYSIVTDINDEKGVDWSSLINNAAQSLGGQISSPVTLTGALSGSASVSVLPNIFNSRLSQLFANSQLMINAMAQQGYSAQHRPVSLLTLNRRWARLNRMNTEGYLSETTPGSASLGAVGAGAPGLKTSSITTGDQYVANAQIMDDNTVLLNFGLSLSDLLGLFDVSTGSGATLQKVQVPRVTAVNAQFPIAIKPGEVVAVTGLSRVVSVRDRRSFGEDVPILFGGSKKESLRKEHFIVLIRPTVM